MFELLARFFLGEPPREKGVHVDLIYGDPDLQAFFLLLIIFGSMLLTPFVSAMWRKQKQGIAFVLAVTLFCAVSFAAVGIFASGFAGGRYPQLQWSAGQQQALK
ncbi:hypothetical protein FHR70_003795 [Microvirga lupini]|uniref:Uncharacterized protein n=1 Tax=Microvirga lupini TaxID=420324 RepID=A0A7W4VP02_9HYPH|nr:hypothetical protein [Microvirga lupini]MBB3020709.1 hypothetical protein [Microvirga lupini]